MARLEYLRVGVVDVSGSARLALDRRMPPVMTDWAGLISFRPDLVLRPRSLEELKAALEQVHARRGRVRVPGSLHSCSEIVVADAILDTSGLPKTIEFDDGDAAVEASANVTLHDFLAVLGRRGKSVTATGGTDHQTLAGLISTGTAPASSRYSLYELLEWVELVTVDAATGRAVERRIARGDDDFPAVVCSLGLLGVLTRVRFRLVDERHFAVVMKVVDIDDVLDGPRRHGGPVRLLAGEPGARQHQGAAVGGHRHPARRVEAGRRLLRGPVRADPRRRLQGARQARRRGPAAQPAAGARLRRHGAAPTTSAPSPARCATCCRSIGAPRCAWRWPSGASARRTCSACSASASSSSASTGGRTSRPRSS